MDDLDARTVALMLLTSSRAARLRVAWEELHDAPAYDRVPVGLQPRDRVIRCASPRCGLLIVAVASHAGTPRRYCGDRCRCAARYWRRKEVA